MGVSTPSTLMLISMGDANPKFSKSGRKPKKTKQCTILKNLGQVKRNAKGIPFKRIDLIRMKMKNKITKMRVCSMIHQDQVWGKIFFSDISSKERDEG